jgi:hypothetical protein
VSAGIADQTAGMEDGMRSGALDHIMNALADIDDVNARVACRIGSLMEGLEEIADAFVRSAHGAEKIRVGVMAKLSAIELHQAWMAVETAAQLRAAGREPKSAELMLDLARKRLLAACTFASEVPTTVSLDARTPALTGPAAAAVAAASPPDIAILRNIASFHREHERYYTWHQANAAADLFREANRIKAVATTWLDDNLPCSLGGNFDDPRFSAAGCHDLNAIRAVGSIGILFMEGEQEPSEFLALKGKLGSMGAHSTRSGKWLAEKMEQAWIRESWLLRDDWIEAAEPRFGTIMTNCCGARHIELAGRCATVALEIIGSLDLKPAGVRSDLRGSGRRLLDAAWVLDCAAQVTGRAAVNLSENETRWTRFLDVVASIPEAAE